MLSMLLTVLLYSVLVLVFIQVIYLFAFSSIGFRKNKVQAGSHKLPVSVVIYVKNKAFLLEEHIPIFLEQSYPNFELVLVNHASSDHSLEVIEGLMERYPNIKLVNVENKERFWANKKYALTLAVKASSHDCILYTELDSLPMTNQWIQSTVDQFVGDKSIVMAPVQYTAKNPFLRYIDAIHQLQSFSFANLGNPFRASKANFAFSKDEFFRVKGYISHLDIPVGITTLFLKDAGNKKNTAVALNHDNFVCAKQKVTWATFWDRQLREAQLFQYYNFKNKFLLSVFNLSKLALYLTLPIGLFVNWQVYGGILLSYYLLYYLSCSKSLIKLKEQKLLYILPILDLYYAIHLMLLFLASKFIRPKTWI